MLTGWFRSLVFVLLGCLTLGGAEFDPDKDIGLKLEKGALVVTCPKGAHLKASFMEVKLKPGTQGKLKVGPMPKTHDVDELKEGIWRGSLRIPLVGQDLPPTLDLVVTYQPCTEGEGGVCFPPTDRTLSVKASDLALPTPAPQAVPPVPTAAETTQPEARPVAPTPTPTPVASAPKPSQVPPAKGAGGSVLWMLLAAFGWGLAASMTPCVYPMIPITMAIVGAKGSGKAKGFALSLSLVLGMAVTYTILGVVAALSGAAFGAFAQSPAFLIPVALLFAVFALSLFGAFEIKLPDSLAMKLQGSGPRQGFGGAFVMGLVLGPLAAPCVGPFLGTVLVDLASKGDITLGALTLFIFAMGMGVLFLAVGTFSAALPKSGDWMIRFKQIMGLLVLGFAVWSIRFLVPAWVNFGMWTVVLFTGAAVFGVFETAEGLTGQARRVFAIFCLALGVLVGMRAVEHGLGLELLPRGGVAVAKAEAHGTWIEQDFERAQQQAKAEGKLILVDIYADWCAQCKELDEKTWPDPAVQAWIKANAVAVRINTDAQRKDLAKSFAIRGYPTVMLMDADGREVRPRLMGFAAPEGMLKWLKG